MERDDAGLCGTVDPNIQRKLAQVFSENSKAMQRAKITALKHTLSYIGSSMTIDESISGRDLADRYGYILACFSESDKRVYISFVKPLLMDILLDSYGNEDG